MTTQGGTASTVWMIPLPFHEGIKSHLFFPAIERVSNTKMKEEA
jgi:hypothetical protein